jgi:hypothetical protein
LNIKAIRAHWDEILRLATSIKQGTVTASLMLRKLGSYPRQNGLAVALRELGRIERTLFILDWLQSVELRRRVHAGLNKGEARNALARAVFFNRLGEIRDRSFEQQRYRASGLNLVTAAIVLWNTVYLERAANALRGHGHGVDEGLLQYLSPLGWEHINLTGDYLWRSSSKVGVGKFRPLRPLSGLSVRFLMRWSLPPSRYYAEDRLSFGELSWKTLRSLVSIWVKTLSIFIARIVAGRLFTVKNLPGQS